MILPYILTHFFPFLLTTLRLAAYENIARCLGKYFSLPRKLRLVKTTIVSAHTGKNRNSEYSLHILSLRLLTPMIMTMTTLTPMTMTPMTMGLFIFLRIVEVLPHYLCLALANG